MPSRRFARVLLYVWVAPTSAVGVCAGLVALSTGGRMQMRCGAIEIYGGLVRRWSRRFGFVAVTLGHVILGVDAMTLEHVRDHEQAHVRQAEVWGPFFIPVYLLAGLWVWSRGGRAYYDNWFERDARRAEDNARRTRDRYA
ncbi:MAG: hypothetical protein KGM43_02210 [Planctomycetota bacterium]|nr:hypothetical protein [Planctomycetota bacterium]